MIKDNSRFVGKIESGRESGKELSQYEDYENRIEGENFCPHCLIMMIRLGTCFSCPRCGYGGCG